MLKKFRKNSDEEKKEEQKKEVEKDNTPTVEPTKKTKDVPAIETVAYSGLGISGTGGLINKFKGLAKTNGVKVGSWLHDNMDRQIKEWEGKNV